jgi:protein AATF/BFR2
MEKLRRRRARKRRVDTRASKGRKTRYVTIDKLVNFHPAHGSGSWSHERRNELFKTLFL